MDKPAAPKNRLNTHCCRIHQIDVNRFTNIYMVIFFNFSPTSNHLHSLQVVNCDSNSRLVVNEDDNCKLRLESVKEA